MEMLSGKIVTKDFPDRIFESRSELFEALRKDVSSLIAFKKSEVQKSFAKGSLPGQFLAKTGFPNKEMPSLKENYIYPVINTTRYMDSHRDVHFDGIWNKTIKDQAGRIFYVMDHDKKVSSVIAWPEDVTMMIKSVPWSFVGKNYAGNTEALIYEIPKNKIANDIARKVIDEKRQVQNSVSMMYVTIKLGMDSSLADDKPHKEYYDKRISEIVNRDRVEEFGYFWGVEEAKIITEGSMVLRGSNDATPIQSKNIEPPAGTQNRAAKSTRVKALNNLLKVLKA